MKSKIETKDGDTLSPMTREEIALSERQILLIQARAALLREKRNRINRWALDSEVENKEEGPLKWWLPLYPLAAFVLLLVLISTTLWW
jgi:hypothetical protein